MARPSYLKEYTNEQLIVYYALNFNKGTKAARNYEQKILKELANRDVIDLEKMKELYEQKAL